MGYDEFILIVNFASITILLVLAVLLCVATRFKGESSYATLIILFTTVPDFIYNLSRNIGWDDVAVIVAPLAYSANLTLIPLLYLLAHRGFNPYYRFRSIGLLHFLPAVAFALLVAWHLSELPYNEVHHFTVKKAVDFGSLLTGVNFSLLVLQLVVYYTQIFRYLRKMKRFLLNHYSQADLMNKRWVPRFITLVGVLLILSMLCYAAWPLVSFWLFYITNVTAMGYLVYQELATAFALKSNIPQIVSVTSIGIKTIEADNIKDEKNDMEQLQQYARQVEEYLRTSEAYVNSNLSLRDVSKATGITYNNISKAINATLGKNFFDLVNGFRVEKSKALLLTKKDKGLTLETIAEQCGFNSRITFNNAFKRIIGLTTTEWLKLNQNQK